MCAQHYQRHESIPPGCCILGKVWQGLHIHGIKNCSRALVTSRDHRHRAVSSTEGAPFCNRGINRVISAGIAHLQCREGQGSGSWACPLDGSPQGLGGLLSSAATPQGIRNTKISLGFFPSHLSPGRTKPSTTNPKLGAALWKVSYRKESITDRFLSASRGYPSMDPAGMRDRTLWECV